MSAPEIDAAKRLGVLTQYVDSLSVPEEALAEPKGYILVNDGRSIHGDAIVVWLAKLNGGRMATVVRMLARLPRRGDRRPAVFIEAENAGIAKHVLSRQGMGQSIKRVAHAPTGAVELVGEDLVLDVLGG